ncbi:Histone H4-like protein [Elsinoe fawcettii]|nr:Histone H4-like protein [Elsinoe fawcettii]
MATSSASDFPGVAFITGAGGTGIGNAVAKGLAQSGCERIAITDINNDTLDKTRADILSVNSTATVFSKAGDIADESFVNELIGDVVKVFSRIDYAVNCAGILGKELGRAADMTTAEFDLMNSINYRGVWLCCRAQLKQMLQQEPLSEQPKQRGSIVNIASQLGIVARPGAGITKPAIRRLARRGGVKRISGMIYDEIRLVLRTYLEKVLKDVCAMVDHSGRQTAMVSDIVFVLNRQGRTLWGFGDAER